MLRASRRMKAPVNRDIHETLRTIVSHISEQGAPARKNLASLRQPRNTDGQKGIELGSEWLVIRGSSHWN
ncbi:MAG TPA: hypothetical protein VGV35_18700, partial [Bryobacteraceae bacterium]|nr:hypothetical protein [Bryobacteraceae bacterium]